MMLVCNKCYPTDDDIVWNPILNSVDVAYLGKWYPVGSYTTRPDEEIGRRVNEYLDKHAHGDHTTPADELDIIHNENPVRLTYETWVRDMPAIKKWEYKP